MSSPSTLTSLRGFSLPNPPQASLLIPGKPAAIAKVLHFETNNDCSFLLRISSTAVAILIIITALALFLLHTATSRDVLPAKSAADLIYDNYGSIIGILLMVWLSGWCLACWLWRVSFSSAPDLLRAPNVLYQASPAPKPTGLVCFLPTPNGWQPMFAATPTTPPPPPSRTGC